MSGCCLLGHLGRCKRSGDWRGAQGMPTKGPTQVMVETVGAGARKSVCFCGLLCWTVVCHERLRSRALTFLPARGLGIGQIAHCLTSQSVRRWRLMCLLVEEERGRYPCHPTHVLDLTTLTASAISQKKKRPRRLNRGPITHDVDRGLTRL